MTRWTQPKTGLIVYALELHGGKFYIDQTRNLNKVLKRHFQYENLRQNIPFGESWTHKWPPVRIHHIYRNANEHDIDRHTLQYMTKYGIENVRGGSYSKITLTYSEYIQIKDLIVKIRNKHSSIKYHLL